MRLFLSKVRLGLNNTQLTMLVRIFDEDCSGVIKTNITIEQYNFTYDLSYDIQNCNKYV